MLIAIFLFASKDLTDEKCILKNDEHICTLYTVFRILENLKKKKLPRFATNFLRYKWDGPN